MQKNLTVTSQLEAAHGAGDRAQWRGGTCLARSKPGSDLQYSVSGVCL